MSLGFDKIDCHQMDSKRSAYSLSCVRDYETDMTRMTGVPQKCLYAMREKCQEALEKRETAPGLSKTAYRVAYHPLMMDPMGNMSGNRDILGTIRGETFAQGPVEWSLNDIVPHLPDPVTIKVPWGQAGNKGTMGVFELSSITIVH